MKQKNIPISCRILFKSALVAFLLGVSVTSYSQKIITTFAGNYNEGGGYSGDGGPSTAAQLQVPLGVVIDASRNIYISDFYNNRIRQINTSGTINTFAGNGYLPGVFSGGYSGDGGPATAAELDHPYGITVDASGNLYIADSYNNSVRIVNTSGIINTFAGNYNEGAGYSGDGGPATAAELNFPTGITVDASGNVYIADEYNNLIRKVNTSGIINTFAGIDSGAISGSNVGYSGDGGPATDAELNYPIGIAVDASGNIYIANNGNNLIREVSTSGIINTFAGIASGAISGTNAGYSGDGGLATVAELYSPTGIGVDAFGNVYIADGGNNLIRIVNTSGIISTIAGNYNEGSGYSGDGGPATAAQLNFPEGMAVDAFENVYIADNGNNIVRRVAAPPPSVSANVTTNVGCNGASTGSILAAVSNGTSPYTYSWSPIGGTDFIASGLSAGTYTITVTDSVGSIDSTTVTITQPNVLSTTATLLSNSSCGGTKGSAMATPSGGTSPYTYSWSPGGQTNSTATGLSVYTYTVTVQDNCGGSATASVIVQGLTVSAFTGANVSCNGGSNGQGKVSVSGGKAPYTYFWSPSTSSTYIASGLSAGSYSVTVTDNHGCSATSAVTITQPTALRDSVATITYPSCAVPTTSASIGVKGGTSPYRYTWSPNISSTGSATNLAARSYVVQVKDKSGCYNNLNFSISQSPVLRDSIVKASIVNVTCANTGNATVGVKYGTSPYTYSWSSGSNNASVVPTGTETFSYTGAIQHWVVPAGVTQITVSVAGAAGGSGADPTYLGGYGASFTGVATVTSGHVLSVVVGGAGSSDPTNDETGGGGGASWVYDSNETGTHTGNPSLSALLAVAAGGGGGSYYNSGPGGGAGGTDLAGNSTTNGYSTNSTGGTGGNGGAGGQDDSFSPDGCGGAGGGGWLSNATGNSNGTNGNDWANSFASAPGDDVNNTGGFGGGGGGSGCAGGGGGGYNGGGGGVAGVGGGDGGGGGSYLSGGVANLIGNVTATNTGNGSVTITIPEAGVAAGTYSVTVTDNCGASATASVTITQHTTAPLSAVAFAGANVSCHGGSNGQAKVSVTGGSSPYTYFWNSGSINYIASGLSAGTYTVTVHDNCGTSATSSVVVSQPAVLFDSLASMTRPVCGQATGSAGIGVTGGTSPYRYTWTPNVSTTATATGLTARSYVVQVKDANGCFNNLSVAITCSQPVTATYKEEASIPAGENINLYPNPNTGQFTLSGLQAGMIIEMYDYTRKKISGSTVINETMQLNISQANGVYLIRILDKDGNLVSEKKVVKMQ